MTSDSKVPAGWTGERYVPEIGGNIRLEHLHRYLIARELSHGRRVLDIACGEGYGADLLATCAASVIGVDISEDVIAAATARYRRPNLEFRRGTCRVIPLAEGSVDIVVCFETLEHVDCHDEVLREVRRVLRPDGVLVISSPERHQYSDVIGNRNPFHVRELYRHEFEELLRSQFQHVAVVGQRIAGGSIVGPLDQTVSQFTTFPQTDSIPSAVAGIEAPVYLLALASDGALPDLPAGLLDGGPVAWGADLPGLVVQVQGDCTREIAKRLGDEIQLDCTDLEAVRNEFTRQANRVSELSALARSVDDRIGVVRSRLAQTTDELAAAREMVRELESRLRSANHHSSEQIAGLRTQLVRLQALVQTYEQSRSWRLTAPLRGIRRRIDHVGLAGKGREGGPPGLSASNVAGQETQSPTIEPPAAALASPLKRLDYQETPDYVALERSKPVETRIKLIAFYLPQFHPIPENDAWWGRGFTEWTSVTQAKPQFAGHYQPHLPGELGFYDLRVPEVQERQIELARLHGVHAFCYYHYWFHGTKLLQRPLEQLLARPELDFPFCLCWANENWTRRWDGLDNEVLIAQEHSAEDDLAFIKDIAPALRDRRYVRVEGRPVLAVYRPALLPDAAATADRWRKYCRQAGIGDPFLVSTHAFDCSDPRAFGFDAAVEFAPINMPPFDITADMPQRSPDFNGVVLDYRYLVESNLDRRPPDGYRLFRSVTPMWDNEARRASRGTVFAHSSPALYGEWLKAACRWTERHNVGIDAPFVFVNAWNEWAEGAHLEPDRRHGYAYLKATANALEQFPALSKRPSVVLVSHDAYFHGAQVLALNLARTLATRLHYNVEVVLCGPGPLAPDFEAVARVHDFSSPSLSREAKLAVARRLYEGGARIAICNTSVVGEAVELFKQAGFSVISLIHELPGLVKERGLEASVKNIARFADRIVLPAQMVRDTLHGSSPPEAQITVQPQGLFAPNRLFGQRQSARRELREGLGLSGSTRIVLAVGYADHRKGIDLFADVGIRMAGRAQDVVFVWVGHHEHTAFAKARDAIESAGLKDRFLFPGPLLDSDLYFAGADAYLMTSREDPFPSVVLQALDAGLPVIGFEGAGGFAELLQRGCGVLVPFGDTEGMAQAVAGILESRPDRERLARTGREILAREFSFVNYARGLVDWNGSPRRPSVSVVIPNYNYAQYLDGRLRSVIDQTVPPHEVIFLDDCSSDDSLVIASGMLHSSGLSYRLIANATNQGTYKQWLRGIREATGDLVWIAEADDVCAPDLLEKLLKQFADPDVVLAYCQSRQIDGEGRELAPDYLEWTADISETKWREHYVRAGLDEIADTLVIKNTIPNVSAVLMRRPDCSRIEEKLTSLKNAGDWLLYVHLLERGKIAFVPEVLNYHRRHGAGVTIGGDGLNLMREVLMVQQHVLERHAISTEADRRRQRSDQNIYEYLGLDREGPASYKDHQELRTVEWAASR